MARPCQFCESPNRQRLETALLRREITQKEAAKELGITPPAVSRHINKHIPEAVRLAISQGKATTAGANVAEQLVEINQKSREILDKALEANDPLLALKAIAEVRQQLRLQAEILGDISGGVTVNVINSPQYLQFRGLVLKVLADYPEAKTRLIKELKDGSTD